MYKKEIKLSDKLGNIAAQSLVGAKGTDMSQKAIGMYQQIKTKVHSKTVSSFDLNKLNQLRREELENIIRKAYQSVEHEHTLSLNLEEKNRLISDVLNEMLGLGPIEPLVKDKSISDILVNTYSTVYIERDGKLELTPIQFRDNEHLIHIINKIVSDVGRRIDESSPMVDARLKDGSRVNAIIPPLAVDGPALSIRKFGSINLNMDTLLDNKSITREIVEFLRACVKSRLNMLISGGTGSGKTTLLNLLSGYIPAGERVITIEDSAELQLQQPHVFRLESRPPNIEGAGEVTLRDLVKNSLRMRPDRIIVGEVRGPEALDMLQAMNTGHDGSMSTIHANSPRDALSRLGIMVHMGALQISDRALNYMMASPINIIIHLGRLSDGKRRLLSVSEVAGIEGDTITLQDIFIFDQLGVDVEGSIYGEFRATGIRSRFSDKITRSGIELNTEIFRFRHKVGK